MKPIHPVKPPLWPQKHAAVQFAADCGVVLSEGDLDFLSQILLLAQVELLKMAHHQEQRFPGAVVIETYRQWAEQACDLRGRIERRQ